jgi:four helix bundle protein
MASLRFQDLKVYQVAEELADCVWEVVEKWNNFARDTVAKQLVRAADSIGANIAEGAGKGTFNDNRRFVRIARGSFNETQELQAHVEKLGPMLNAYLKSIGPPKTKGDGDAPHQLDE